MIESKSAGVCSKSPVQTENANRRRPVKKDNGRGLKR